LQLRKAVRQVRPAIAPNVDKWAGEIGVLTRRHGIAAVQTLLDWYVQHIGQDWVPVAHSAKAFKSKFEAIGEARTRIERDAPLPSTPAGVRIHKRLKTMHWSKGSDERLPQAVERHLVFWNNWLANAKKIAADMTAQSDMLPDGLQRAQMARKAHRVSAAVETFGTPSGFVLLYFQRYNKRISGWDDWSGVLPEPNLECLCDHHSWNTRQQGFKELLNEG
jgi:hypothetical protein